MTDAVCLKRYPLEQVRVWWCPPNGIHRDVTRATLYYRWKILISNLQGYSDRVTSKSKRMGDQI